MHIHAFKSIHLSIHSTAIKLSKSNFWGGFQRQLSKFELRSRMENGDACVRQISVRDAQREDGRSRVGPNQCLVDTFTIQREIRPAPCPPIDLARLMSAQGTWSFSACRGCQVEAGQQIGLDLDGRLSGSSSDSSGWYSSAGFDPIVDRVPTR